MVSIGRGKKPPPPPTSEPLREEISENIRVLLDTENKPDIHNIHKINEPAPSELWGSRVQCNLICIQSVGRTGLCSVPQRCPRAPLQKKKKKKWHTLRAALSSPCPVLTPNPQPPPPPPLLQTTPPGPACPFIRRKCPLCGWLVVKETCSCAQLATAGFPSGKRGHHPPLVVISCAPAQHSKDALSKFSMKGRRSGGLSFLR